MSEWSQLPRELLVEIRNRLKSLIDIVRLRSVCSTWREAATWNNSNNGFDSLSLSKRSIVLLSPPPPIYSKSSSWVIKTEEKNPGSGDMIFHLLDPLSRTNMSPLPSMFPKVMDLYNVRVLELGQEYILNNNEFRGDSDYVNLYMEKVALLLRGNDDFLLLTIHVSGKLAMFSHLDKQWRVLDDAQSPFDDVINLDGEFFAVDNTGRAVVVGFGSVSVSVTEVAKPVCGGDKKRLVGMGGELILVDVYMGLPPQEGDNVNTRYGYSDDRVVSRPIWFKVFKLDKDGKNWVEVKSLGNNILFLGVNCAFSASATDLSCHVGNCIYYCFPDEFFHSLGDEDDEIFPYRCGSVFNLEDASISDSTLFWPPSWLTTSVRSNSRTPSREHNTSNGKDVALNSRCAAARNTIRRVYCVDPARMPCFSLEGC